MRAKIHSKLNDLYKYKDEHRATIIKALGNDFLDCELGLATLQMQNTDAQIAYAKWNQAKGAIKTLEDILEGW